MRKGECVMVEYGDREKEVNRERHCVTNSHNGDLQENFNVRFKTEAVGETLHIKDNECSWYTIF